MSDIAKRKETLKVLETLPDTITWGEIQEKMEMGNNECPFYKISKNLGELLFGVRDITNPDGSKRDWNTVTISEFKKALNDKLSKEVDNDW